MTNIPILSETWLGMGDRLSFAVWWLVIVRWSQRWLVNVGTNERLPSMATPSTDSTNLSISGYREPIGSRVLEIKLVPKMNDLDICLEVVLRSCQLMRHICHWISCKPLEIEAWFQRTTELSTRNQLVDLTPKGQTHDPNVLRAQYLENSWRCYLAAIADY